VSGVTVLVSADQHMTAAGFGAGAAYVYQPKDGRWAQIAELSAGDGVAGGAFGSGVAVQNNTLLVGALGQHPQVDNGQGYPGGEAYILSAEQLRQEIAGGRLLKATIRLD
jgi:hypothetical protein